MVSTNVELVNEEQASATLRVSPRTLQAWRVRGGGPAFIKMGRSVRYRIVDLQEFVNGNVHHSTSEESYRVKANLLMNKKGSN